MSARRPAAGARRPRSGDPYGIRPSAALIAPIVSVVGLIVIGWLSLGLMAGIRDAIAGHDVSLEIQRVEAQSAHVGAGVAAQISARDPEHRPDAIAAGNDLLALGLLHGLINAGLSVPSQISLVGYDDIEFADYAFVPLSTIRHPAADLGASAVRLLLGLETAEDMEGRFEPRLIARGTSLPV